MSMILHLCRSSVCISINRTNYVLNQGWRLLARHSSSTIPETKSETGVCVGAPAPVKFTNWNAKPFLDHIRSEFLLPKLKGTEKTKTKTKGGPCVTLTFAWPLPKNFPLKENMARVDQVIIISKATKLTYVQQKGLIELAERLEYIMAEEPFRRLYDEVMASLPAEPIGPVVKGDADAEAAVLRSHGALRRAIAEADPSTLLQLRPFWVNKANTGCEGHETIASCLNYCEGKLKLRIVEKSINHQEEIPQYSQKKRRKYHIAAVDVHLTLLLGPSFPLKDTMTELTEVVGKGSGTTLTLARKAARLALFKNVYRVYKDNTPLINLDLSIPSSVLGTMQAAFALLEADGGELFKSDHSGDGAVPAADTQKPSVQTADHRTSAVSSSINRHRRGPRMSTHGQQLPIWRLRKQIIDSIESNQVTILTAATGSGKTTQVPQFILDQFWSPPPPSREECTHKQRQQRRPLSIPSVVVTQPRRIAAVSLAQRVAQELEEAYPYIDNTPGSSSSSKGKSDSVGQVVGHAVRFDSRPPFDTSSGSILFCTTGVLLRQMQADPTLTRSGSSSISGGGGVTHIILDEVHDRAVNTDLLLLLTRNLLMTRPDLKLIVMSATIEPGQLVRYFSDRGLSVGTVLDVKGSTNYPISKTYLGDILTRIKFRLDKESSDFNHAELTKYSATSARHDGQEDDGLIIRDEVLKKTPIDLIRQLVLHICNNGSSGAILVFVPGWDEIVKLQRLLQSDAPKGSKFFTLHSSASAESMEGVFDVAQKGIRKIVLATNIAESSITIPDVVHVVDSGKQKVMYYDQRHRMDRLETCWVSNANMKQRTGRAGRLAPGHYYGLFNRQRCDAFPEQVPPELMRLSLDEVCLLVKSTVTEDNRSTASILGEALDPPDHAAVSNAVSRLLKIGALTSTTNNPSNDKDNASDQLTPLGRMLSTLPMSPAIGKMLITSVLLGCLDPMLTIVAGMGENLLKNMKDSAVRRRLCQYLDYMPPKFIYSDHMLVHELWLRSQAEKSLQPFVSFKALERITVERRVVLRDLRKLFGGHIPAYANENTENSGLLRLVLASGLLPDFAVATEAKHYYRLRHMTKDVSSGVASSCHNYMIDNHTESPQFFVYADLLDTGKQPFISNMTAFDPILLPLFDCHDDWIGLHGHVALDQVAKLKDHWSKYLQFMVAHQLKSKQMSVEQVNAAQTFRHAMAEFAASTSVLRQSREAMRVPPLKINTDEAQKTNNFSYRNKTKSFNWDFLIP